MKRGEVVLIEWIDSDLRPGKRRPALVVQADFLNARLANTVFIQVTKTIRNAATEVLIDPAVETASGLRFLSVASCNNFLTVQQAKVARTLGFLSAGLMQQIDSRLRTALEL